MNRPSTWERLDAVRDATPSVPPPRSRRRRWIGALVALSALLAAPFVSWRLQPDRRLAVVIVDKTVPHRNWREHASFVWWLEHRKVRLPDGRAYDIARDYVGAHPGTARRDTITDASLAGAALIYVADAYGVYDGDFADDARARQADSTRTALERSSLQYGGLDRGEVAALASARARGAVIAAEFNTIATPTARGAAGEAAARLFGARHTDWIGRWYADLASADEIPGWMRAQYQRYKRRSWDFTGAGVVLVSEVDDRVVVLDASLLADPLPVRLVRDARRDPLTDGITDGRPYPFWFGGLAPLDGTQVLAWYELAVNDAGADLLTAARFPGRFPALTVRRDGPAVLLAAGELADMGSRLPIFARTRGVDGIRRWLARRGAEMHEADDALWHVAGPVWDALLAEAGAEAGAVSRPPAPPAAPDAPPSSATASSPPAAPAPSATRRGSRRSSE